MSEYSAEERGAPNGPAPYPARTDEPRPSVATSTERHDVHRGPRRLGPGPVAAPPVPAPPAA